MMDSDNVKIKCSLIIPLHNHESSILEFHRRLAQYLSEELEDFQDKVHFTIIYVDDGSRDLTQEIVKNFAHNNTIDFKLIVLKKNFGQTTAISIGMLYSAGEIVIIRSADFQDSLDYIKVAINFYIDKKSCVILVRKDRRDNIILKMCSCLFYWLVKSLYKEMPVGGFDYALLTRSVANTLIKDYYENRFLQYDIMQIPADKEFIYYTRSRDRSRSSSWTLAKRFNYVFNAIAIVAGIRKKKGDIAKIASRAKIYIFDSDSKL